MGVIAVPPQLVIAEDSWRLSDPRIIQEAEFTAATEEIQFGPAARWTCEARIVARTPAELLPVRAFLASMSMPGNWCLLTIAGIGQLADLPGIPSSCAVKGAGQLGWTLAVDGLTPSVLNLRAGHGITIDAPSGRQQLCILRADLVANGAGEATAQLGSPLREAPADNAAVSMSQPFAQFRLRNPQAWSNGLFQVSQLPSLLFEERI